ncbi:unnamed protein product [Scytosiphon promiscuus]
MPEHPEGDGWMETWISCALDVRQRQSGDENDSEVGDKDDDDNTFPNSEQSSTTCKQSAFIQRRELTLPSRYPSTRDRGPPDGPRARPWTASAHSDCRAMPSNSHRSCDTRVAAPAARPHSAAGAIGRRSGGGCNAGHMASAGKAWVREISKRVAPRRPASSRVGQTAVKGDQPRKGGTQKASSRIGQGCHRRAGQSGQVRVLAAWSYEVSKRHGQGCGGVSPPRQILVKVPCKKKRCRDAPYRLAFNHEVNKSSDDRRTRDEPDNGNHAGAVPAEADDTGNSPGGPGSSDSSVDSDAVCATLAANATSSLAELAPSSSSRTAAVTVQLPRPTAGEEVLSTTTDGKRGSSRTGHGFGSTGLRSASESSGWQSLLEENEKTPSMSRVIAKLRASVARDTRPSSAASFKPTTASAAAAGSGLLPVPVMEVRLGGGITEPPPRPRPQSAAGVGAAASRTSRRTTCQRTTVLEGRGGATGGASSNVCTHDSAQGGVVVATEIPRIAEWEKRRAAGLRPKSAGMVRGTAERRRMDLTTQGDYSFFPSTPADRVAEGCHRSDPVTNSVGPFWGGAESQGDVTEWESSLCSSSSVAFVTSTVGYAIDTPRSWKEPADI